MAHIEPLHTLGAAGEALLRARAEKRGRESGLAVQQIADALSAGKLSAAAVYDDQGAMRGIAAWRWQDAAQAYAQVILTYIEAGAPAELAQALVSRVFVMLQSAIVIEIRLRDNSPGVRDAWIDYDFAVFERCRMVRALGRVPVPVVAPPAGYRLVRWDDSHQPAAEQVARLAVQGTIDDTAVPDVHGERGAESLRRLRSGQFAGADTWNRDASLVVLEPGGEVAGYVATVNAEGMGVIAHVAVHPEHRRRGLARFLMARAMYACEQQGLTMIGLAVTTRNPARSLYNQLGFQTTECGEVAIWWRDGRQLAWLEET